MRLYRLRASASAFLAPARFPGLDLVYLVSEDFRVFGIEAKQNVFDVFDFFADLFRRFEQAGVVLHFVAKFSL